MTRTTLIIGALIFALAAAGVLVWTGVIDPSKTTSTTSAPPADTAATVPPATLSREAQLVNEMSAAAAGGGFAVSFVEADVRKWQLAEGQKLERFSLDAAGPVFARLTSPSALDKASVEWATLGLSLPLPVEFANMANGRKIEVGFVARAAQSNGSSEISAIYATQQAGNSGWQAITLKPSFEAYKFVYDVPRVDGGYTNGPIVVFHSDAAGSGRSIELIGAYVKFAQ